MIRLAPCCSCSCARPRAGRRRSARSRSSASMPPSRSRRTAASTSPRRSRPSSPAPGTGSTAPCRWSTARRRDSTGPSGSISSGPPTPDGQAAQGREQPGAPLHQVQDLGARGGGRHPHRRAPLPGRERAPLLRGARRALLERHRRRVGRADRGRHRPHRACRPGPPASAPSPSTASTAPPRATPMVDTEGTTVRVTMPHPLGLPRGAHRRGGLGQGPRRRSRPKRTRRSASWRATGRSGFRLPVLLGMFALWRRVGRDPEAAPGRGAVRAARTRSPRRRPAR